MISRISIILCAFLLLCTQGFLRGAPAGAVVRNYYVYVAAESEDAVYLVRFGPGGGEVVKRIPVGVFPTENEGPHGVLLSPGGSHWYVSLSHGKPFGQVFKYRTGEDVAVGNVRAGLFPASLDISRTTGLMFVANFNLYGDLVPGTVSVLDTVSMNEVALIEQGIMPHGSRTSPDGKFHYSVAMMDDELYEIDVMRLEVSRRLPLGGAASGSPVKPTWVDHHPTLPRLYVALQGGNRVVEVDRERWAIRRSFETQPGPYNLAVSPDGRRLLITCKPNHSTAIWDLESGSELASVPASRRITHGVTVAPDNRFAFVSVEGVGGERGAVDVVDLQTQRLHSSIEVGKQASGIDFWKME